MIGRDAGGRFAAGCAGGPGRPKGLITGLNKAQGLAGRSAAILNAMNQGEIDPEQCAALLSSLASLAKCVSMETLELRVNALESRA
jgi:hypothetical protein